MLNLFSFRTSALSMTLLSAVPATCSCTRSLCVAVMSAAALTGSLDPPLFSTVWVCMSVDSAGLDSFMTAASFTASVFSVPVVASAPGVPMAVSGWFRSVSTSAVRGMSVLSCAGLKSMMKRDVRAVLCRAEEHDEQGCGSCCGTCGDGNPSDGRPDFSG